MKLVKPESQYKQFIFESYDFSDSDLSLKYSFDGEVHFEEVISFGFEYSEYSPEALDRAFFILWLLAGVSYYKSDLPVEIVFRDAELKISKEQATFVSKTWLNGLGEFFLTNNIDFRGLCDFSQMVGETEVVEPVNLKLNEKCLVPVGGGKDSLVTTELLKSAGVEFETFTVGEYPFLDEMVAKIGQEHVMVKRKIGPELIRLNKEGGYNGHVPISSIWAMIGACTALLRSDKYVVLSNEASANEGNTELLGMSINHQYSKSLEFEKDLQSYLRTYVATGVEYFSLLRPLSEVQIIQIFVDKCWEDYKSIFTSCNRNFTMTNDSKNVKWCGECDKCAFVAVLLAAFVPRDELVTMFGKDIFNDESLVKTFEELSGVSGHKPFECVGTPEEVNWALREAVKTGEYDDLEKFINPDITEFDINHLEPDSMPAKFKQIVTDAL